MVYDEWGRLTNVGIIGTPIPVIHGRTYKYMSDNIYFPFGYGLSYGHVDYSNLQVTKADRKEGITLTLTLTNRGDRTIDETPQVYITALGAGTTAPLQQLAAFQRVNVAPGTTAKVQFTIPTDRLMTVQEDGSRKLLKGDYTVTVSSAARRPAPPPSVSVQSRRR